MVPTWVSDILEKDGFSRHSYYLEVRHNHRPHGVVAMYQLGATEQFIEKYLEGMNINQVAYNPEEPLTEELEIDYIKSDNIRDYRGKNNGFYKMRKLYLELLKSKYNGDMIAMIKGEVPAIIDGPLYAAFHGVISIVYGMIGKSDKVMLEGLIFMDEQYSPMMLDQHDNPKKFDLTKFGLGTTSVLDTFQKLHENTALVKQMKEEDERDVQLRKDTHMGHVLGWSGPKYHGEYFLDLADDLKFPEWFDPKKEDINQLLRLLDWFLDMAIVLYVKCSTINDFFLLHGVTGTYCFKYLVPLLDYNTALKGFRGYVASIFSVYMTQEAPALSRTPDEFVKGEINQAAWEEQIKVLLSSHYETHVYKVNEIVYELWKKNQNSEYANYYFAAAVSARENVYGFGPVRKFTNHSLTA